MKTSASSSSRFGRLLALAAISSVSSLGTSHAAIIVTSTSNVAPAGTAGEAYDPTTQGSPSIGVSNSDLATGLTATVTYNNPGIGSEGTTTAESSTGESAWTNGTISTVYGTGHAAYGTVYGRVGAAALQTYVTFDLGALYDISQVNVILGWNDSGRDDSSFILLTSVNGVDYTEAATYTKNAVDNTGTFTTPVTNLHSIADDGGADIASGVQYVQLQFTDADNGFAGLAEVDIFGTASIPEPSSIGLLALGGLMAGMRRRRA